MDSLSFKRLPAELRNTIWELALCHKCPIGIDRNSHGIFIEPTEGQRDTLALTTTCQVIREETIRLFYGGNTFRIPEETGDAILRQLRRNIGDKSFDAIGTLQVMSIHAAGSMNNQAQRFRGAFERVSEIAERHGPYIERIETQFILREWNWRVIAEEAVSEFVWLMSGDLGTWPELDWELARRIQSMAMPNVLPEAAQGRRSREVSRAIAEWQRRRSRISEAIEVWKAVRESTMGDGWQMKS